VVVVVAHNFSLPIHGFIDHRCGMAIIMFIISFCVSIIIGVHDPPLGYLPLSLLG
jgi:hypothetical protein